MALSNHRPHERTGRSPKPRGHRSRRRPSGRRGPCFVIQHHGARENCYDFRLEIDGVLVSWAIPRGPAVKPQEGRMARRTEDRPLDEVDIEIDDVDEDLIVWDRGTYANKTGHEMTTCLGRGHLSLLLDGEKLRGCYALTRVREGDEETWLLVKRRDDVADAVNRLKR
ncbi:DNA polymerase ligase N-terminal domain-containing protein [Mycobacterium sp.]|uniref:DNA polymerase ligase N-terminal domain-containing protein n=1 Tax=Mycobacterium sp. TaxID=1785 RepID=UPI0031DE93E3